MPHTVEITSFGYLHGDPPPAHIVIDMREHFRDPHAATAVRYLTAEDQPVRSIVLRTPGVRPLIDATVSTVMAYRRGVRGGAVHVAFGCAGGRHRAATAAATLADELHHLGVTATVTHRDLRKPVIEQH